MVLLGVACGDADTAMEAGGSAAASSTGATPSSAVGPSADDDAQTGANTTTTSDTSDISGRSDDDDTTTAGGETSSQAAEGSSGDPSDIQDGSSSGDAPRPVGEPRCGTIPTCDDTPPPGGPLVDWNHFESEIVDTLGGPNHRGRDMFYVEGDEQWVLAKFAYGINDWDLEGERVDLYLQRGCEGRWELLDSVETTFEGDHPTVEGVEDTGGRIYYRIPQDQQLGPGYHRIHMIVAGDRTRADMLIAVVDRNAPMFISDVDGTLTTAEAEEFTALLTGETPQINPFAADALELLASKGYWPMYLTARPEFLGARTREFVQERGLPLGLIHTTLSFTGALGDVAVEYKSGELDMLASKGLEPTYVFGNTDSDAAAYEHGDIQPLEHRVFFQFDDELGGRTIESYSELLAEFDELPNLCE